MYKQRNKHTRKNTRKAKDIKQLVYRLLQSLIMVKLYHWNTQSYSVHKATDQLYDDLNTNIDKFIEVLLGKNKRNDMLDIQSLKIKTFNHNASFMKWLEQFKKYLIDIDGLFIPTKDSDILNIRDEILADLNKISYMLSLK